MSTDDDRLSERERADLFSALHLSDRALVATIERIVADRVARARAEGATEGETTIEAGLWFDGGIFETYDNAGEAQWAAEPGDVVVTRQRTRYPDRVTDWQPIESGHDSEDGA